MITEFSSLCCHQMYSFN